MRHLLLSVHELLLHLHLGHLLLGVVHGLLLHLHLRHLLVGLHGLLLLLLNLRVMGLLLHHLLRCLRWRLLRLNRLRRGQLLPVSVLLLQLRLVCSGSSSSWCLRCRVRRGSGSSWICLTLVLDTHLGENLVGVLQLLRTETPE